MQVFNIEMKNPVPVLNDLVQFIRHAAEPDIVYLRDTKGLPAEAVPVPGIHGKSLGISEALLPGFLKNLGIRSLTLAANYSREMKCGFINSGGDPAPNKSWQYIKDEGLLADFIALFKSCRTVAFDDWAQITGASNLGDGLHSDVLQPINKMDVDFIFYLGNPDNHQQIQVDEILDIICHFRGMVV